MLTFHPKQPHITVSKVTLPSPTLLYFSAMRKFTLLLAGLFLLNTVRAQNPLYIPDTLSGLSHTLHIYDTSHVFYSGFTTRTYGINGEYGGPVIFLNRNDSVSMHVVNDLMDTSTIHWHGMHVSPKNDGGPHITIAPNATWQPSFKVRDQAATYWYHPHLHMMTNEQASMGAAGMIIVRDAAERAISLPRTYGKDDFPLMIQSKHFDAQKQIMIGTAQDSIMMVNGTIKPYLVAPAQVIRLRLLNATPERVYNIGLEGNLSFYMIGSDGGLLNAPVALTRLLLAPGERAEILVDLTGKSGQTIRLMSFASQLPSAIYGAAQPGMGAGQQIPNYSTNPLNGNNFPILTLSVVAQTANAITSIPTSLQTNTPWNPAVASNTRTLTFSPVNMGPNVLQGPFVINNTSYNPSVINQTIVYNDVEVWSLTNQSPISHPFHIHDVQFYILDVNGAVPPPEQVGRKDVVLVRPGQTVRFITQFETFCDDQFPYMYHCHMLPHEDDGMMGQFLVKCPVNTSGLHSRENVRELLLYPNPGTDGTFNLVHHTEILQVSCFSMQGQKLPAIYDQANSKVILEGTGNGLFLVLITTTEGSVPLTISILH